MHLSVDKVYVLSLICGRPSHELYCVYIESLFWQKQLVQHVAQGMYTLYGVRREAEKNV